MYRCIHITIVYHIFLIKETPYKIYLLYYYFIFTYSKNRIFLNFKIKSINFIYLILYTFF